MADKADIVSNAQLDKIEERMSNTPDDMVMAVFPNASITANQVRSMIAELRRRRRKMGYTE